MTACIQTISSINPIIHSIQLFRVETWKASKAYEQDGLFPVSSPTPNVRQASFFSSTKPRIDYTFERNVRFFSGEVRRGASSHQIPFAILLARFCEHLPVRFSLLLQGKESSRRQQIGERLMISWEVLRVWGEFDHLSMLTVEPGSCWRCYFIHVKMIHGLGSATRYLAIGSVGSSFSFLIDFRSFFLLFLIIIDETIFYQQDQIPFPFFFTDATPILFQGW